jgi:hypothetical protein
VTYARLAWSARSVMPVEAGVGTISPSSAAPRRKQCASICGCIGSEFCSPTPWALDAMSDIPVVKEHWKRQARVALENNKAADGMQAQRHKDRMFANLRT